MRGKQVKQLRRVARALATDGIWAGVYGMDRRGAIRHAPGTGKSWLKVLKQNYRRLRRKDAAALHVVDKLRPQRTRFRCSNGTTG